VDDTDAELLQALVQGFDRAMLVSRCGEEMRSRPTVVANTDDTRRLWLLSGIVGDSLDELSQDPHVNVVMQDGARFCSVTGTACVARPTGDEPIWNDQQRAWLAQSRRHASVVLIEVAPHYAEYWDRSGLHGLRFDTPRSASERDSSTRTAPRPEDPRAPPRAGRSAGARDNVISLEQERWKRSAVAKE
jgi:general stress protein 26